MDQTVWSTLYLSYNGQSYDDHPYSVYDHKFISLGNIDNRVVSVGSWNNNQVELFDITSNTWTTKKSFPYCIK